MHQINIRLAALILGLGMLAIAPATAFAAGEAQPGTPGDDCRAVTTERYLGHRLIVEAYDCPEPEDPMARYGIVEWTAYQEFTNRRYLDWETIRFLEANLWGPLPLRGYIS